MLKFSYDKESDVPEAQKEHYTEADGKWVLSVEGAVPQIRLTEATKANNELKKDLKKFEGIDPAVYKELNAKKETYEAGKADNDAKVQELVDKRVAKIKEDSDNQIATLTSTNAEQKSKLHTLQIDGVMLSTANEMGLKQGAASDLVARARSVWTLDDDGKPVAMAGEETIYGKTGEAIGAKEWLETLAKDAPHLFEESKGAGSGGSGKGGSIDPGENPWKDGQINITKQAAIFKEDREKAARMASQAGKRLKI